MRVRRSANVISFRCPGCGDMHTIPFEATEHNWAWNGDVDRPTISPSISIKTGHYGSAYKPGDACWCTYNQEHADQPSSFTCYRCHSEVIDGKIKFCPDSTHALSGREIELPEIIGIDEPY